MKPEPVWEKVRPSDPRGWATYHMSLEGKRVCTVKPGTTETGTQFWDFTNYVTGERSRHRWLQDALEAAHNYIKKTTQTGISFSALHPFQ